MSFYTFNVSNLCILHPWRWSLGWFKHVGVYCVHKVIWIYLNESVGTIFKWICWYHFQIYGDEPSSYIKGSNFLSSSSTISFWRTLAHGVSHSVSYGLWFVWTNIHSETIKRDLAHFTHIRNMKPQNGGMWRLGYSIVPEPTFCSIRLS